MWASRRAPIGGAVEPGGRPAVNLAANLVRSASHFPDNVAIRLDDITVTYSQLEVGSQLAAGLLSERGVQPGDRVAIMIA